MKNSKKMLENVVSGGLSDALSGGIAIAFNGCQMQLMAFNGK